jgi:cellulose synthase/poly-beta-1,6-N-acetylglucosamine synthase-like glycosyltransferase
MNLLLCLKALYALLNSITMGVLIYQVIMALMSGRRKKSKYPPCSEFNRFAVVISARNEINVIGHLLDSLNAQQYPRECFDIYVIADNCTDDTARVSREHGALVYERSNLSQCGKGYALQWIFDIIHQQKPDYYDAYCIFDADNLADKDFLMSMNRQL